MISVLVTLYIIVSTVIFIRLLNIFEHLQNKTLRILMSFSMSSRLLAYMLLLFAAYGWPLGITVNWMFSKQLLEYMETHQNEYPEDQEGFREAA